MNDPTPPSGEAVDPPLGRGQLPRRLYRHPRGPVGGVASGLAAYFDVDPAIVRLLFILGALAGFGLPAYVICWIAIPKARAWPPHGYDETRARQGARQAGITSGLVLLALVVLAAHSIHGMGDFVLPAVLVGFGVFLLSQQRRAEAPPSPESHSEGAADLEGEADFVVRADERGGGPAPGRVTPVVLTLLCLLGGVAFSMRAAGLVHFSLGVAAAVALIVVGVGLFSTRRYGRAPGLTALGIALSVIVAASAALQSLGERASSWVGDWGDGRPGHAITLSAGNHRVAPTGLDELEPSYRFGAGQLVVDLSDVDFSGAERSLDVRGGLGEVRVLLPRAVGVDASVRIGAGHADVLGHVDEGLGVHVEEAEVAGDAGKLTLSVRTGVGEVKVRRVD